MQISVFFSYLLRKTKFIVNIRKIIQEEIEKLINKNELVSSFDNDIKYLKGFELEKKEINKEKNIWVFQHKNKNYTIRFYIQKNNDNSSWEAKIFIYWKIPTKEFTNAKGKDFEYKFGPFNSYDLMISELNRKLENNPLISVESYFDDTKTQFDNDVIEMLKLLLKYKDKLNAIKDEHFKDVKKILKQIENINTEEGLRKFAEKKAESEAEKQTLLIVLQKVYLLDFFTQKEKMESLF